MGFDHLYTLTEKHQEFRYRGNGDKQQPVSKSLYIRLWTEMVVISSHPASMAFCFLCIQNSALQCWCQGKYAPYTNATTLFPL